YAALLAAIEKAPGGKATQEAVEKALSDNEAALVASLGSGKGGGGGEALKAVAQKLGATPPADTADLAAWAKKLETAADVLNARAKAHDALAKIVKLVAPNARPEKANDPAALEAWQADAVKQVGKAVETAKADKEKLEKVVEAIKAPEAKDVVGAIAAPDKIDEAPGEVVQQLAARLRQVAGALEKAG